MHTSESQYFKPKGTDIVCKTTFGGENIQYTVEKVRPKHPHHKPERKIEAHTNNGVTENYKITFCYQGKDYTLAYSVKHVPNKSFKIECPEMTFYISGENECCLEHLSQNEFPGTLDLSELMLQFYLSHLKVRIKQTETVGKILCVKGNAVLPLDALLPYSGNIIPFMLEEILSAGEKASKKGANIYCINVSSESEKSHKNQHVIMSSTDDSCRSVGHYASHSPEKGDISSKLHRHIATSNSNFEIIPVKFTIRGNVYCIKIPYIVIAEEISPNHLVTTSYSKGTEANEILSDLLTRTGQSTIPITLNDIDVDGQMRALLSTLNSLVKGERKEQVVGSINRMLAMIEHAFDSPISKECFLHKTDRVLASMHAQTRAILRCQKLVSNDSIDAILTIPSPPVVKIIYKQIITAAVELACYRMEPVMQSSLIDSNSLVETMWAEYSSFIRGKSAANNPSVIFVAVFNFAQRYIVNSQLQSLSSTFDKLSIKEEKRQQAVGSINHILATIKHAFDSPISKECFLHKTDSVLASMHAQTRAILRFQELVSNGNIDEILTIQSPSVVKIIYEQIITAAVELAYYRMEPGIQSSLMDSDSWIKDTVAEYIAYLRKQQTNQHRTPESIFIDSFKFAQNEANKKNSDNTPNDSHTTLTNPLCQDSCRLH